MSSEVTNVEEISAVLNDLIQDIEEQKEALKTQRDRISRIEDGQKEMYDKAEALAAGFSSQVEATTDSKVYPPSLETHLKQWLEETKEEVKKQHTIVYQTKQYSVFNERFRAEHFAVVVNTVMKWVIILVGALSFISIIKFLLHYN